jgi:hypothetical protein
MKVVLTPQKFLTLVLILICINLIFLDFANFEQNKQIQSVTSPVNGFSDCPNCSSRITELETKLNSMLEQSGITITPTVTPTPIVSASQPIQNIQTVNSAKEYYVPFGSGSGSYSDWTDIPGLQVYIDSNSYGNIKSVTFEASLHIPTGNETAGVRLVNATDGRVISGSELDFNGNSDSVLLSSSSINLDYGEKLYKVQLKTQLGYPAYLDQSRIHILTQ